MFESQHCFEVVWWISHKMYMVLHSNKRLYELSPSRSSGLEMQLGGHGAKFMTQQKNGRVLVRWMINLLYELILLWQSHGMIDKGEFYNDCPEHRCLGLVMGICMIPIDMYIANSNLKLVCRWKKSARFSHVNSKRVWNLNLLKTARLNIARVRGWGSEIYLPSSLSHSRTLAPSPSHSRASRFFKPVNFRHVWGFVKTSRFYF